MEYFIVVGVNNISNIIIIFATVIRVLIVIAVVVIISLIAMRVGRWRFWTMGLCKRRGGWPGAPVAKHKARKCETNFTLICAQLLLMEMQGNL